MIIGGPSSQLLAGKVAAILGQELALCEYKTFPDGELYSQIATELDDDVTIIQSTPKDSDIEFDRGTPLGKDHFKIFLGDHAT